jgi:hypothetical protein
MAKKKCKLEVANHLPLELNEIEFLTDCFLSEEISPLEQLRLVQIFNRVFSKNEQPTMCGSCWRDLIKELKKVLDNQ